MTESDSKRPRLEAKPILISVPVGNNPARIRLLIYLKGIEDQIQLKTPFDYGGMQSDEYKRINPQGKMPVLILPDGTTIYESKVISGYILDRWNGTGPKLQASTPEARALAAQINAIHDLYVASPNASDPRVTATQGCMYKPVDVIDADSRALKVAEIAKQLDVLEGLMKGPFCVGEDMTEADLAMYPTFIFFVVMLPKVFGWPDVFHARPKLKTWMKHMETLEPVQQVKAEVEGGLQNWEQQKRFDSIIEQIKAAPGLKWVYP